MAAETPRRAWLAWGAVCVIWGTTYLAIKLALTSIPPFLLGGLRYTVAGAALGGYLRARGDRWPERRNWPGFALLGLLMFVIGNGGVVWAEMWVASGLAAVVIATSPFWMVGVEAFAPGGDRLEARHLSGLALGFLGILLLVGPSLRSGGGQRWYTLAGVIALQLACAGWAVGSSYGKRHAPKVAPAMSAAAQMLCGGLLMLTAGSLLGEWRALRFTPTSAGALVYLTVFGSLAAFVAYIYALTHLPVSIVSLYAYVNPVIAVALGTVLLGEPFDARMVVAVAVILAGLAIVSSARRHQLNRPDPQ
jgi:drug/metabolite transporter (DMT)-like permease